MVIETTIALILIFGVLVMFHELGHFVAARRVGIRVEEFALGFGPKLVRLFKRGDTEYTLHPFPLGGFVKLAGMEPGEENIPDGFQAQAIWKRALVIFSGPFASFILAVIVFVFIGVFWGFPDLERPRNTVAMVQPQTEAARIGLRAGDRILEINGRKITRGTEMLDHIHNKAGERVSLLVERDGKKFSVTGTPRWTIEYLGAAWSFDKSGVGKVDAIAEDSEAKRAGIQKDDEIVRMNGRRIASGGDMIQAIKSASGKNVPIDLMRGGSAVRIEARPSIQWVRFLGMKWLFPGGIAYTDTARIPRGSAAMTLGVKVGDQLESIDGTKINSGEQMLRLLREGGAVKLGLRRDGQKVDVNVPPSATEMSLKSGRYTAIGLLGFMPKPTLMKLGLGESISKGLTETWDLALRVLQAFSPKRIKEDIGGPVMIAKLTASSVALGVYYVVRMAGMLSLSLAFINLVPVPVLDGGHIAILLVEAIRRKRLTREQMAAVQFVGVAIIGVLFVMVLFSDLVKISGGMIPQ